MGNPKGSDVALRSPGPWHPATARKGPRLLPQVTAARSKESSPRTSTLSSLWASVSSSVEHLPCSEMLSALEGGGAVGILSASSPWPWQCLLLLLRGFSASPFPVSSWDLAVPV